MYPNVVYRNYVMPNSGGFHYSFPCFAPPGSQDLYIIIPAENAMPWSNITRTLPKVADAEEYILPNFICKICFATISNYCDFKCHLRTHTEKTHEALNMVRTSRKNFVQAYESHGNFSSCHRILDEKNYTTILPHAEHKIPLTTLTGDTGSLNKVQISGIDLVQATESHGNFSSCPEILVDKNYPTNSLYAEHKIPLVTLAGKTGDSNKIQKSGINFVQATESHGNFSSCPQILDDKKYTVNSPYAEHKIPLASLTGDTGALNKLQMSGIKFVQATESHGNFSSCRRTLDYKKYSANSASTEHKIPLITYNEKTAGDLNKMEMPEINFVRATENHGHFSPCPRILDDKKYISNSAFTGHKLPLTTLTGDTNLLFSEHFRPSENLSKQILENFKSNKLKVQATKIHENSLSESRILDSESRITDTTYAERRTPSAPLKEYKNTSLNECFPHTGNSSGWKMENYNINKLKFILPRGVTNDLDFSYSKLIPCLDEKNSYSNTEAYERERVEIKKTNDASTSKLSGNQSEKCVPANNQCSIHFEIAAENTHKNLGISNSSGFHTSKTSDKHNYLSSSHFFGGKIITAISNDSDPKLLQKKQRDVSETSEHLKESTEERRHLEKKRDKDFKSFPSAFRDKDISSNPVTTSFKVHEEKLSNPDITLKNTTLQNVQATENRQKDSILKPLILRKISASHWSFNSHRIKAPFALNEDQTKYQNLKDIVCVLCKSDFSCISSLRKHLLMFHINNKDRRHCPYCNYKCFQTSDLEKHVARRHTRDFKFKCLYCIKGFATPKELSNHSNRKHGA